MALECIGRHADPCPGLHGLAADDPGVTRWCNGVTLTLYDTVPIFFLDETRTKSLAC